MNLYELSKDFRAVEAQLDQAQDEGAEGASALLLTLQSFLERDVEDCAGQVVRWIRNEEATAEAIDEEIKRLQAKKRARENRAEALRIYLRDFMKSIGKPKIDATIAKVSILSGRPSLVVDNKQIDSWPKEQFQAALAAGALAIVESYTVAKNLLKTLPDYQKLPGVTEVIGEDSITIR